MRAVEKRLRERIQYLEETKAEVQADREKLREHFATRFRYWIQLMGEQKTPSLPWLIEHDAKTLANLKWWSW